MDETRLQEKLAAIQALFEGTTSEGERAAAANAREKLQARLAQMAASAPPSECKFTFEDAWSRRLFAARARRYGLEPYRYVGQRRTTLMVRVSKPFVDQTLWPEFVKMDEALRAHLDEVTERVISTAVHPDASEAKESPAPKALGQGG